MSRGLALAGALLVLHGSLTQLNRWPTPWVEWNGALSVELVLVVLTLAVWVRLRGPAPRSLIRLLAGSFVWLTICRYMFVTAPALYGRNVSLYWDVRFLPDVTRMLVHAAPAWAVALVALGIVVVLGGLYLPMRWAWRTVARALDGSRTQLVVIVACVATLMAYVAERTGRPVPGVRFTATLSAAFAQQIADLRAALQQAQTLPASPSMASDLSRVAGADVLVVFVESYGAVTYDRPEMAAGLAGTRDRFARDIAASGRQVVSAFVESPTFGGNSWLAHVSLQSGIEVRDEDRNFTLMGQARDTLPKAFARRGYRAIGLIPGLKYDWPEGRFYGYTDVFGASRLGYRGPSFGWFELPDQWTLARADALVGRQGSRAPVFILFPTLSTHIPFMPVPPYQSDWSRLLGPQPFDAGVAEQAQAREPDWFDLGASYLEAVRYELATFGGYLQLHADRDLVLVMLGDHQPPAVVSGEGQPWDVPVHVIASRTEVLDRLVARGFTRGLTPVRPTLSKMHELLPVLLDAFGDSR